MSIAYPPRIVQTSFRECGLSRVYMRRHTDVELVFQLAAVCLLSGNHCAGVKDAVPPAAWGTTLPAADAA